MTVKIHELETERTLLRPLEPTDAEAVFSYASDPEVCRYVSWPAHRTLDDSRGFLEFTARMYARGGYYDWAVIWKENGRLIGTCGLPRLDPEKKRAELGYVFSKEYWGRGIATEVAREVVRFGFEEAGLNSIEAVCFLENTASERVMVKLGMKFRGIIKYKILRQETPVDSKCYFLKKPAAAE